MSALVHEADETRDHEAVEAPRRLAGYGAFLAVFVISLLYVARHLNRGWVPFDEGAMAQAAERVLRGELPHRDFDDIYTGGLAMWDALAFRTFGVTLMSMRLAMFGVFALWIPAVYYLASRVSTRVRAAFATFLAVVWSVPNYNAAMPSWYNLFLATFAIAALSRYVETDRRRWIFAAGVAIALSVLVKVVGIYLIAGALLFFVQEEQLAAAGDLATFARVGRSYSLFVVAALALFVVALAALVYRRPYPPELVQCFMPGALLAGFLAYRELGLRGRAARPRLARLLRMMIPFACGLAIPILIFLIPYVQSGSLSALFVGVFILPTRRFGVATMRFPPLVTMLAAIPVIAVICGAMRWRRAPRWYEMLVMGALVIELVHVTATSASAYRVVWYAARSLFPLLVLAGAWALWSSRAADRVEPKLRRWAFLLLACSAMGSLVQFPFAAPSYFLYVAPLVILSALVLLRYAEPLQPVLLRALYAAFLMFGMFRMNISLLTRMGVSHVPYSNMSDLALERGGLRISRSEAALYDGIVTALRQHARGEYTWASPDLPEIYFLSGLRNPTRSLFDFIGDPEARTDRLMQMIDAHGITAVVLNLNTYYSKPLAPDVVRALEARFPNSQDFGPYELRWRT